MFITDYWHFIKPSVLFGGTIVALYFVDKRLKQITRAYIQALEVKEGIDVLNYNKMLTFGINSNPCSGHSMRDFECANLDCNYGRLSYMLNFVNKSHTSVDVCIYIITAKLFGDAIINAHKRGVRVRVIADSDMSFSVQSYINVFRMHNIPTRQRMSPYIMHHKFMIVDDQVLISGSMNFTMTGVFCNWENVLITSQPQLVQQFSLAFHGLWQEFGLPIDIEEKAQSNKNYKKHQIVP